MRKPKEIVIEIKRALLFLQEKTAREAVMELANHVITKRFERRKRRRKLLREVQKLCRIRRLVGVSNVNSLEQGRSSSLD